MVQTNKHGIPINLDYRTSPRNKRTPPTSRDGSTPTHRQPKNVIGGEIRSQARTLQNIQFRKHRNQMSEQEVKQIVRMLHGIKRLEENYHLRKKESIQYNKNEVYSALANPYVIGRSIIEYNERWDRRNERWTQRVLLRLPKVLRATNKDANTGKITEKHSHLCVVLDITTKQIITVYYNEATDNHKSLNLSNYRRDMIIRQYQKGGYKRFNAGLSERDFEQFKLGRG